ncbi:glycolate oxidase subunit GlcF [Hydrocarboniphaga effusa]|uniref:Glycolate oxidase iron-sulfur subunit n=1 Tax=Hydrocarboniphaga effusa AP103 TaxID=1172194 RepID=I8TBL1_9GAMM|nr:glycolate oxidase subunit GlcF [Hydrocarboniphaga effusa]EIT71250.1 glycolate oxidase iron-sulfur subunit [Hydrocarboniphaga effusa AP103]
MQTRLDSVALQLPRAAEAESILRSCVHCGFCNATCPTYQLLGDELDGPRGRIYQIKQMLEGGEVTRETQLHLDRCLTCRNCETTCPSGVRYHSLLDIGREEIARRVPRTPGEKLLRGTLRRLMTQPALFGFLLRIGRLFRPLLPALLRDKVPAHPAAPGKRPLAQRTRKVLMLEGCVQPSLSPNTNAATARVLDKLGIQVQPIGGVRCCGAVDYHLDAQDDGLNHARRNIDAWWPAIEAGAEAIVQTASGCGAFVKEYGHLLERDPAYAAKARKVSALALDLVEVLRKEPLEKLRLPDAGDDKLAFHCPCTLQHAQKLGGAVEDVLKRLGFPLTSVPDAHLCCGSAGTYSITQPELSKQLRDNKLVALQSGDPQQIVTANIGCQTHLAAASKVPVRHWIEIVDQSLRG